MLKRKIILSIILSLFAHQALAAAPSVTPVATTIDPRIRHYAYNENTVYRLDLYLKSVTALQFASGEEVQSILIGDSASWEVVKLKSGNVVSIKPVVAAADTNMTIYTDKRVYSFDLHSAGQAAPGAGSVFRSVFTYPAERKARVNPAADTTQINSDYLVSGDGAFRPKWVQDNGRQTTFFLPKNSPRPAIFKVGADKKEELVNSRTNGDRIIVDGTANFWVLRIGDQMVCVGVENAVKKTQHPILKAQVSNDL